MPSEYLRPRPSGLTAFFQKVNAAAHASIDHMGKRGFGYQTSFAIPLHQTDVITGRRVVAYGVRGLEAYASSSSLT